MHEMLPAKKGWCLVCLSSIYFWIGAVSWGRLQVGETPIFKSFCKHNKKYCCTVKANKSLSFEDREWVILFLLSTH